MDRTNASDLLEGRGEWRNIQDVVRSTFQSLVEGMQNQADAIQRIERTLMRKADGELVEAGLRTKASATDLDSRLTGLTKQAAKKSSLKALEITVSGLTTTSDETLREIDALGAAIKSVKAELGQKCDAADVAARLRAKASTKDVSNALARKVGRESVVTALKRKADRDEVERALLTKADVDKTNECLAAKVDVSAFNSLMADRPSKGDVAQYVESRAAELKDELTEALAALRRGVADKVNSGDFHAAVAQIAKRTDVSELSELAALNAEKVGRCVPRTEFSEWSLRVAADVERHQDQIRTSLSERLSALEAALKRQVEDVAAEVARSGGNLDARLGKHTAELGALQSALDAATDRMRVTQREVDQAARDTALLRADVLSVREQTVPREELAGLLSAAQARADERLQEVQRSVEQHTRRADSTADADRQAAHGRQQELEARVAALEAQLTEMKGALDAKADVDDMCALLDVKPNISTVNDALAQLSADIHQRVTLDEFQTAQGRQTAINNALSSEHAVARWLWKSGKLKATGAVPWNVQLVNSSPANFLWVKNRATIQVVAPGLYQVSFGFFGRRRPTIQVHVNGEPVLSAVSATGKVVYHAPRSTGAIGVTGQTLSDFVALPPNAQLQLTFSNGDPGSQGFLALRKL
eukprot:gnl/Chilomastix_cuspidata/2269.p1 GENE.gnl/Chilomastix_cuspidata/2269~~gnl/Chilomastix_cuspidata/2269.p1  ORF type:complete len:648 (+),score=306.94 gnl/Chilomastix_cuspidata/2269:46-1989(+)